MTATTAQRTATATFRFEEEDHVQSKPVVVGALQNVIRGVAVDAVADADLHVLAHVDDAHLIEAVADMTTIVDDEAKATVARAVRALAGRASAAEGQA
jgi:hypothetical protein